MQPHRAPPKLSLLDEAISTLAGCFQHLSSHQSPDNQIAADAGILQQYKDLIREQDQRINEITQANLYLQQELTNTRQQAEELASSVQALQDQNALLRYA